jgi:hypothetical protein
MNHTPLITPARRGYSARNRRRYTRQRRTAAILILAVLIAGAAFLALS